MIQAKTNVAHDIRTCKVCRLKTPSSFGCATVRADLFKALAALGMGGHCEGKSLAQLQQMLNGKPPR